MTFRLSTDQFSDRPVVSFDEISALLKELDARKYEFLILIREEQHYIQTLRHDFGFDVERRSGDAESHAFAAKPEFDPEASAPDATIATDENVRHAVFARDEVEAIFRSYYLGTHSPLEIRWHSSGMGEMPESKLFNAVVTLLIFGVLIALGIGIGYWLFG